MAEAEEDGKSWPDAAMRRPSQEKRFSSLSSAFMLDFRLEWMDDVLFRAILASSISSGSSEREGGVRRALAGLMTVNPGAHRSELYAVLLKTLRRRQLSLAVFFSSSASTTSATSTGATRASATRACSC